MAGEESQWVCSIRFFLLSTSSRLPFSSSLHSTSSSYHISLIQIELLSYISYLNDILIAKSILVSPSLLPFFGQAGDDFDDLIVRHGAREVGVGFVEDPEGDEDPECVEEEEIQPSALTFCQRLIPFLTIQKTRYQGTHVYIQLLVSRFGLPVSHSGANVMNPPYSSPVARTIIQNHFLCTTFP